MTSAILDTNVLVQATISSRGASFRALHAGIARKYQIVFSPFTLGELRAVLNLSNIRALNTWSDHETTQFIRLLASDATLYPGEIPIAESIARDVTDTKFLSLAQESNADFLVTNDRRHLLPLGQFGHTKIVTPARFLKQLR